MCWPDVQEFLGDVPPRDMTLGGITLTPTIGEESFPEGKNGDDAPGALTPGDPILVAVVGDG